MTLRRFEAGIVNADRGMVEFLVEVFDLEEPAPFQSTAGTLYRFGPPGMGLKVMVPTATPTESAPVADFLAATGLRYLTMYVDDLDSIVDRFTERGGKVTMAPIELGPGIRIAILQDPFGNAFEVVQSGAS